MTDADFSRYRKRQSHRYHGGFFRMLPARIVVPYTGYWNTTIDLGGGRAHIQANIDYLKAA
jgi:Domain of unknown function (DUF1883)